MHAWEDVKAMFNGGSRKRLASPTPPSAGAKSGRAGETTTSTDTDRRLHDESAGRVKRLQRGVADAGRVVTADRPASVCVPHPRAGFYLHPPPSSSYPAVAAGPGTGSGSISSISQPQYHHHHLLPPPPASPIQSGSTACVPPAPYHDIIRMQMLAAAGDAWKARTAAAAAAAAVSGVCPITPHISMVWPPTPADFLSTVGRPRNPLEQFLSMPSRQRALAAGLAELSNAHRRRSPAPGDLRKPYSAFRLVSDVDDRRVVGWADNDDDDEDNDTRTQLDSNANHCDENNVAPHCDDKLNNNEAHGIIESSEFISQQRTTNEV